MLQVAFLQSAASQQHSVRWTRRKRDAVERAAGIGADAAAVTQRHSAEQEADSDPASHTDDSVSRQHADGDPSVDDSAHGQDRPSSAPRKQTQLPIGAFQRLPQVQVSSEQLSSALRKAQRLPSSKTIKNEAAKARNRCRPAHCMGQSSRLVYNAAVMCILADSGGGQCATRTQLPPYAHQLKCGKGNVPAPQNPVHACAIHRTARQMDFTMKALTGPLTTYMRGFPAPPRLHPFERALLDLTVGEERYVGVLQRVDSLRKKLTEVGSEDACLPLLGSPQCILCSRRVRGLGIG